MAESLSYQAHSNNQIEFIHSIYPRWTKDSISKLWHIYKTNNTNDTNDTNVTASTIQNVIGHVQMLDKKRDFNLDEIYLNANKCKKIFPNLDFEYLVYKLKSLWGEPNGVQIVIKQLLYKQKLKCVDNTNKSSPLKRTHVNSDQEIPAKVHCLQATSVNKHQDAALKSNNQWSTYRDSSKPSTSSVDKTSTSNLNKPPSNTANSLDKPTPVLLKKPNPIPLDKPIPILLKKPTPIPLDKPTPIVLNKPTPIVLNKPTPIVLDKPTPIILDKPTPIVLNKPTPIVLNKPTPIVLDKPTPIILDKPTPIVLNKPTPIVLDKPTPILLDKPTPILLDKPTPIILNKPTSILLDKPTIPIASHLNIPSTSNFDIPTTSNFDIPSTSNFDIPTTSYLNIPLDIKNLGPGEATFREYPSSISNISKAEVLRIITKMDEPSTSNSANNDMNPLKLHDQESFETYEQMELRIEKLFAGNGSDHGLLKKKKKSVTFEKVVSNINNNEVLMDAEGEETPMNELYYRVLEMFPDAEATFLKKLCRGKNMSFENVNEVTNMILSEANYPKRTTVVEVPDGSAIDVEAQLEMLKQVLPDADPNYLMTSLQSIESNEDLEEFIANAFETKKYPTKAEYLRRTQVNQYTTEFNVDKFLEIIPNPTEYFEDPKRKFNLVYPNTKEYYYVLNFLKNQYPWLNVKNIKSELNSKMNIILTCNMLDHTKIGGLTNKRKVVYPIEENENIPLLQMFAYIRHKTQICEYIKNRKEQVEKDRLYARKAGLMLTCSCCYDEEVMPDDIVECPSGCLFCKECVQKSVEITFSEGRLEFLCLSACGTQFTIQTLQKSLNPKLFSKVAQKKQVEEVKAAGIEDLEVCPFCDFATIPAPGNKIFECLNSDCMKQTCRLCKEPSHVPLKCDEVEKDEDVKKRKYVEDKMTEALIRVCWKCQMKFIKSDGCNKMTCSCGAQMCYICNKPVTDYKHFNGQGGDRLDLCPLYSDTNELHKEAVIKGAASAKKKIGADKLKVDPTDGVEDYFKEAAKNNPINYPPMYRPPPELNLNILAQPQLYYIVGQQPPQNVRHYNAHQH